MKKFDYVILTATNFWASSGTQKTEKELQEDIEYVRKDVLPSNNISSDTELVIFKAEKMEYYRD